MPIDFPNSPTNGDKYTVGTKTWQYDGTAWNLLQSDALISTSAITTDKLASKAVTAAKMESGGLDTESDGAISIMDIGA